MRVLFLVFKSIGTAITSQPSITTNLRVLISTVILSTKEQWDRISSYLCFEVKEITGFQQSRKKSCALYGIKRNRTVFPMLKKIYDSTPFNTKRVVWLQSSETCSPQINLNYRIGNHTNYLKVCNLNNPLSK